MKEVVLNGFLGDKFGRNWKMKANNISDIFACIEANKPSFRKEMIEFAEAGGDISIHCGGIELEDKEELLYNIGPTDIIITPLPAGAKGGGSKLLMAALIVGSLFIPGSGALLAGAVTGGTAATGAFAITTSTAAGAIAAGGIGALNIGGLALLGLASGLAIQGLGQVLAPDPSVDSAEANDEYLFGGPENTVAQNNAVPVLLGEMIVGGVLISTSTSPVGGTSRGSTGLGLTTEIATAITGGANNTTVTWDDIEIKNFLLQFRNINVGGGN
jgi:predicted phage tail protein